MHNDSLDDSRIELLGKDAEKYGEKTVDADQVEVFENQDKEEETKQEEVKQPPMKDLFAQRRAARQKKN